MADQVCVCTHFGDHHPDAEDSRCKVIGCDCAEFREQPGPTRTMGVTMSVETAIGLEIEAALALNVHAAAALGQRIYERVVQPVIANLEAEVERQRARAEREHAMWHDVNEAHAALAAPSPVPRVWKKGDPEPPADVVLLRNVGERVAELPFLRRHDDGWRWVESPIEQPDGPSWAWRWVADGVVLTEVAQDGSYPDGGADA